jgi:hypothetical protein
MKNTLFKQYILPVLEVMKQRGVLLCHYLGTVGRIFIKFCTGFTYLSPQPLLRYL